MISIVLLKFLIGNSFCSNFFCVSLPLTSFDTYTCCVMRDSCCTIHMSSFSSVHSLVLQCYYCLNHVYLMTFGLLKLCTCDFTSVFFVYVHKCSLVTLSLLSSCSCFSWLRIALLHDACCVWTCLLLTHVLGTIIVICNSQFQLVQLIHFPRLSLVVFCCIELHCIEFMMCYSLELSSICLVQSHTTCCSFLCSIEAVAISLVRYKIGFMWVMCIDLLSSFVDIEL